MTTAFPMSDAQWATIEPRLAAMDVLGARIFRVTVDLWQEPAGAALDTLNVDEFERLGRLSQLADRARFVAVRSVLRRLIGQALGVSAREAPIEVDARGKPRLSGDMLWFSVAHSGAEGLIAMSRARPVGVDIERLRAVGPLDPLVETVLSPDERLIWRAAPPELREGVFFRAWTAKESLLKAAGYGLLKNPADLTVLDGPDQLIASGHESLIGFDPAVAQVRALPAPPGYAAALAVL